MNALLVEVILFFNFLVIVFEFWGHQEIQTYSILSGCCSLWLHKTPQFLSQVDSKKLFWIFRFFPPDQHWRHKLFLPNISRQFLRPRALRSQGLKKTLLRGNFSEMLALIELRLSSIFISLILNPFYLNCERFKLRSHFISRLGMIVQVNVALNSTVVVDSDWRFGNLCDSHIQSQSDLYHVSWWY